MMTVCINVHALTANSRQARKYMDTLVFAPMYFSVLRVTWVTWLLHTNAPTARGLTCHFVPYIMLLQKIISYKIFPVGRGLWLAKGL